jgi:hypothetical protein
MRPCSSNAEQVIAFIGGTPPARLGRIEWRNDEELRGLVSLPAPTVHPPLAVAAGADRPSGQTSDQIRDHLRARYPSLGALLETMLDCNKSFRVFEYWTAPPLGASESVRAEAARQLYRLLKKQMLERLELVRRVYLNPAVVGNSNDFAALRRGLALPPQRALYLIRDLARLFVASLRPTVPGRGGSTRSRQALREWIRSAASGVAHVYRALPLLFASSPERFRVIDAELRVFRDQDRPEEQQRTQRLLDYFRIAQITHVFTLGVIVALVAYTLWQGDYDRLAQSWPGWLVGASFSYLASRYYTNVFSSAVAGPDFARTEFWLRMASFLWAGSILSGVLLKPSWWPLFSAIGVGFTTLNNYYVARLCVRARDRVREVFGTPPPTAVENYVAEYGVWWVITLLETVSLLILWITMVVGDSSGTRAAGDDWLWAIMAALGVNAKMYFGNCGASAPRVRAGLEWFTASSDRARLWEGKARRADERTEPQR